MTIVLFCHSVRADWNNGHVHFLRGVITELERRGHDVRVFEPADAWSTASLIADDGEAAVEAYREAYPTLRPHVYQPDAFDLDAAVEGADLVLVHEWNEPALVRALGQRRAAGGRFTLLFHDMHHRSVSDADGLGALDLDGYDGVLAFGETVRERFVELGWARRAWTWHEAADTHVFQPRTAPDDARDDIVWVGNWGDDERTAELHEYLLAPAAALRLAGRVHGVRYPADGVEAVRQAGLTFAGRLPNHCVPATFGRHRVTVHVPRRPYVAALPGIPTIRVFEALACGIPLVCAPWNDVEGLFQAGDDYLLAADGAAMTRLLRDVLHDDDLARHLRASGLATIARRHTCRHRVDELLRIVEAITSPADDVAARAS